MSSRARLTQIIAGDPGAVDAFFAADDFASAFLPEPVAVDLYARLAAALPSRPVLEATFIADRSGVLRTDGTCPPTRDGTRPSSAWGKAVERLRTAIATDARLPRHQRARATRALIAADSAAAAVVQRVIDRDGDVVDVDVAWRVLVARVGAGDAVPTEAREAAARRVAEAIAAHHTSPTSCLWPQTLVDTCPRSVVVSCLAVVIDAGRCSEATIMALMADASGAAVALARIPRLGAAPLSVLLSAVDVDEQHQLAREHWSSATMREAIAGLPAERVFDDVYVDLALSTLLSDPAPSLALLCAGGARAQEELTALRTHWLAEAPLSPETARLLAWSVMPLGVVDPTSTAASHIDADVVAAVGIAVAGTSLSAFEPIAEVVLRHGGARGRTLVASLVDRLGFGVRVMVQLRLRQMAATAGGPAAPADTEGGGLPG